MDPQQRTSVLIVALVFGILIIGMILRIRNSWLTIRSNKQSNKPPKLAILDLTFSGIILTAILCILTFYIFKFGL